MRTQQGQALFWICLTGILNKETGGKKINKTPTLILIPHLNRRRDHRRGPTHEGKISGEQNLSTSAGGRDPKPHGLSQAAGPGGLPREQGWKLPGLQGLQETYKQHLQRDRMGSFQNKHMYSTKPARKDSLSAHRVKQEKISVQIAQVPISLAVLVSLHKGSPIKVSSLLDGACVHAKG